MLTFPAGVKEVGALIPAVKEREGKEVKSMLFGIMIEASVTRTSASAIYDYLADI